MPVWFKVKWIDPLFHAFDVLFPSRDHGLDGTIGDLIHSKGKSGHNPDDTVGVQAERSDADTKPEVRAADVDIRLHTADDVANMQRVIDSILASEDRRVLIYIIFNGWIYHIAADGTVTKERYTGRDKHTNHAHFSGTPLADEYACKWESILKLQHRAPQEEEDMGFSIKVEKTGFTSQALAGVQEGNWPKAYAINVCNDTGGRKYALRLWWGDGQPGNWKPVPDWEKEGQNAGSGVRVLQSGEHAWVDIPKGCKVLTLKRELVPGETEVYSGDLSVFMDCGTL